MIRPLHPPDAPLELLVVILHRLLDGLNVGLVEALCDGVGDPALGPGEPRGAQPVPEEEVVGDSVTQLFPSRAITIR